MENDDGGAERSAGQECPALKTLCVGGEEAERLCECGGDSAMAEVTAEERAVIRRFLGESGNEGGRGGRAPALARAALKFAAVLLLGAGVVAGYADADDMDDVGCTVAQQPGGISHSGHSAQGGERPGGKVPGSDGGSDGGSGDAGPDCRPECEARAMMCEHRVPDGQCRRSKRSCRLFAGAGEIGEMVAGIHREIAAVAKGNFDLRKENEELRRLQSDGMFKFALRVEPEDFQAFAAIIALGNRSG
jgi:hypothetical protein